MEFIDITKLIKTLPRKLFEKGETLHQAGEECDEFLFIEEGFVKAYTAHDDGSHHTIWIAGHYDTVPSEIFFQPNAKLQYQYEAMSDGAAFRVQKSWFIEMLQQNLKLRDYITTCFSEQNDALLGHVNALNQPAARAKLVHALHSIAQRFSAATRVDLHHLGLPLTHQDVAELVGLSRETVSAELKHLMDDGLISYTRSSFIIYTTKLKRELQTPAL